MKNEEIVKVLRGMAMDVFRTCEGCDLEENCSVRGCAILMAAADAMENLQTENNSLHQIAEKQAVMNVSLTNKVLEMEKELEQVKAERDAALRMQWECVRSDDLPDLQEES